MATWGGYFASIVRKKPDPVSEPNANAQSSTIDQIQSLALSTEKNDSINTKATPIDQSSSVIEVPKKLYDFNTTSSSNNENVFPRSTSNAARVAKMFGYASPAASIASATSVAQAKVEPTASITPVEVKSANFIAPTKESGNSLKPATHVDPISSTKSTEFATVADSKALETSVNKETKKPVGLVPWIFSGKSEKSILGSKEEVSSTTQATANEKIKTTPLGPSGIPASLDVEVRVKESIATPIIKSLEEPFEFSDPIRSLGDFSDQNENISISTNLKPAQHIATATNLPYPVSVMTSSSASTRWNQSSGFSSPASRRDSIFSRVSSSSVRYFDISIASIEEQVARDLRLQVEKENSMKYLALTRSIEQMRAERESMDSERMRMINEEELFKRDEVELKEKDEQMRRFIADVEREQEKEREREAEEARAQLQLEREEREQRELEREKEETRRRESEEREQRESEKRQAEEIQSRQLRKQERVAEEEREIEERVDRRREVDKIERLYSQTSDSDEKMKAERNTFEEQDTVSIQNKFISDDDGFSIYDDYYEEETDGEENDIILSNRKVIEQDYRSRQEQTEEDEYEEELKRQRSLQNGKLRQEEEERQRYAEEQGLPRVDQFRNEQQLVTKSQQSQRKGENIRRQQEVEELNALEAQEEKEENIRKAEQKMRQAFAEMTKQKGQSNESTGLARVPEPQPPMRTLNQNIIRPPGGLPAGPRGRKAGF
ncbi:hypothetical protein GcC1_084013 [Golovinomyces cichoracearum]|uniref:Uncharacterized protein n=1 Tax=Golovinomyces cichoracearum TaxID=62708 RepID=A0A420IJ31_9PEZI|nr:hypothetical protein GcC1_084013 [Golovinomyces cichoracearum]